MENWRPTSAYAADIGVQRLAHLVAPAGADGVVLPLGGKIAFRPPDNTSWVGVNVTRGPTFGKLLIEMDPSISDIGRMSARGDVFAAERVWFASLNPARAYTVTLSAADGPVALHSVTFYDSGFSSDVDEKRGGTNIGAIVGGVIGGGVALAALCAVVWLLGKEAQRRRIRREMEEDRGPHWLVDGPLVTPYPMPLPEAEPHTPSAGALQTARDRFIVAALTVWTNLRDSALPRPPAAVPVQPDADRIDMEADRESIAPPRPLPALPRPAWPRPWRAADEPEQIPLMQMPQPNPVAPVTPIEQGWQDIGEYRGRPWE